MDSSLEAGQPSINEDGYPPRLAGHQPEILQGGERWQPRLTGYQILYVIFTAGFGLSKAGLAYRGYSTTPTTLDWLYGVVVFLG